MTTSSSNYTGLYGAPGTAIVPSTPYGNANVVGLLSAGTDGGNTVSNIDAAGNVTASFFIGDGSQLTNLPTGTNYSNANVAAFLPTYSGALTANTISATGNIVTDAFFVGNFAGNISGNIVVPGLNTEVLFNNNGNAGASADFTFNDATNVLSVNGNVAALNYSGSGAALSNITGANVSGAVALATQADTANVANSVAGANVSGTVASATVAATVSGAAQANITSVGTLTALSVTGNVTSGNVSTAGNVSANYFLGNGSLLTGIAASYGNTEVAAFLPTYTGAMTAMTGNITTTGNITGAYIFGNGSQLTGIAASYGNADVADYLSSGTVTSNIISTANIAGGNIQVGNVSAFDSTSTRLDIGGWNAVPRGRVVSTYISPWNDSATIEFLKTSSTTGPADANVSVGNIQSNGTMSAVGLIITTANITGANLVATANLTSTQQTVIGTANVGTTGNIVVSGKNIATDMQWNPDGSNAITGATGRVVIGTGWNGNITYNSLQSRLNTADAYSRTNTAFGVRQFNVESLVSVAANVTQAAFRQQALGTQLRIGGGASANTVLPSTSFGAIFAVAGGQFNLEIGNIAPYNLGNITINQAAINGGAMQIQPGSTVNNAYGINCLVNQPIGQGSAGNVGNYIGYSSSLSTVAPSGNVYMFYNGNASTAGVNGVVVTNSARAAANYYFLRNDDDVAQAKLGSLRTYHEFETPASTSGSFAIDKAVAQVHNIVPTGNCTITGYSNMVVSASDGTNNDAQVDTITIIVEQGATPYTVTLPTGSAYKYAGNVSTVGTTANAVTLISVTAANVGGTTTYLTTVSPEFV